MTPARARGDTRCGPATAGRRVASRLGRRYAHAAPGPRASRASRDRRSSPPSGCVRRLRPRWRERRHPMSEQGGRRVTSVAAVLIIGVLATSAALVVARVGRPPSTELTGIISSEKEGWLGDERTAALLAEHDLDLQLEQAGSRDMAIQ